MKRGIRFILIMLLFFCFILVRAYQVALFYDPLNHYFANDYLYLPLPDVDKSRLFVSYLSRYLINSLISFAILKIAFPHRSFIRTIATFYALAFVLLSSILFSLMIFKIDVGYLFPFYIRRFIIHPVFIIVLLPFIYLMRKRYRMNLK
ncbi:exosortase F system-associated membrane protein [Wenyingzhuangia marina]|uniref:Exosortase F-associated protein n=1 Tax=Wenyingzhuangia marina TaxID=1195760 RepID=A0A1M5WGY5_9FLAO|nr:exosortase F system-associated protein [Wenyingzhuangia marina]SHH86819.1 exosortase F-associated protein [Wenyingzhuangia marina]